MVPPVHRTDYAGDLGCREAYDMLSADATAQLIDVRTRAEWTFVGVADLGALGRDVLLVEWQRFPGGDVNPAFVEEVDAALAQAGVGPAAPLLMLCRSGGRSAAAAAALTAAGFAPVYNVTGGFEGDLDSERHRGRKAGWKAQGLPWRQS